LNLTIAPGLLAICRLDHDAPVPGWAQRPAFFSITRTARELSIVCAQGAVPAGVLHRGGWRCLHVEGPLDFALTGILESLAAPPARAEISVFAISTHDTDLILVQDSDLGRAREALEDAGHRVISS
jgi:hypothetical protein